jgi:hypothetical protein
MCPLGTHAGPHYAMIGYVVSNDADQTPKPFEVGAGTCQGFTNR